MLTFDIAKMLNPAVYDHPVNGIELIETHISWVVLTGEYAYKIKKPVNFGFLDFSTLQKRLQCCEQELRLNSRLAGELYVQVQPISVRDNDLFIGNGKVIEYAVKMKQFEQSAQLDQMLADGSLTVEHMEACASMVSEFHQNIEIADETMQYGNTDLVRIPVEENFQQIRENLPTSKYSQSLEKLQHWSEQQYIQLQSKFTERKQQGFIRECHGDMHLRNMLWLEHELNGGKATGPMAFDCIEFNAQLRWIDVISEVAFLVMDLQDRNQQKLANRFLNSYLQSTGDYGALNLLPYYLCYRAMVRAKVDALRLQQPDIKDNERQKILGEFESYLTLANSYTKKPGPRLIIMRGVSASGKSTISQQLVDTLGAIRLRSDVERKRLFNIKPSDKTENEVDQGIYSKQASILTYARLLELAKSVLQAGMNVIVDAAFLQHEKREAFQKLARQSGVGFLIIEVTAPYDVLKQRIQKRQNDVSDADLKVLEYQLKNWQPLHSDELEKTITFDSSTQQDLDKIHKLI